MSDGDLLLAAIEAVVNAHIEAEFRGTPAAPLPETEEQP